jgi:hypothetical protein
LPIFEIDNQLTGRFFLILGPSLRKRGKKIDCGEKVHFCGEKNKTSVARQMSADAGIIHIDAHGQTTCFSQLGNSSLLRRNPMAIHVNGGVAKFQANRP